jgi:hypothetical protein
MTKTKSQKMANKCYDCKYQGEVPGSAHSKCNHPDAKIDNPIAGIASIMAPMMGPLVTKLNVKGDPYGIKSGWFAWPLNFDPVWLEKCDGFKQKKGTK